eukprot:XP_024303136.1 small integral membrane protein 27 isoform X1 [Homo sapiens]
MAARKQGRERDPPPSSRASKHNTRLPHACAADGRRPRGRGSAHRPKCGPSPAAPDPGGGQRDPPHLVTGGQGPRSRDTAPQLRAEEASDSAARSEWAGARARLKDGCWRLAATAWEVTVRPAAPASSRGLLPPPYHEASKSSHAGLDLFSVAACHRFNLLGLHHLCFDGVCKTTAKEEIPRQNLWDE